MKALAAGRLSAPPTEQPDRKSNDRLSVLRVMMDTVALDRINAPLIGRADELAELLQAADLDGAAVGGSALLGGDAGVGKTRMLAELRTAAQRSNVRVLVGHCVDFGDTAPPYLPFAEMFSRLAADDPATAQRIAEHHPATSRLAFRSTETTAPFGRGDLLDDVHSALSELAQSGPVLVIVEDAHWADRSTQDMLSLLFTRGFRVPVSIVVSYRTDDLHRRHPLRPALAQWARLPGVHRMTLAPLADGDVSRLVRSLHTEPLAESIVHGIVHRAEGNAFFAEELVGAAEAGMSRVPDDLAGLLLVRLDSLDETARTVVRAASVAGRRVSHTLLAQVTGLTPDVLDAAVRTAVERNVLVPSTNGYAFRHALLAESVYDDLLPGERTKLHAGYVRAMTMDESTADAADLARHARAAHDPETAARAGVRAGAEAMEVGGPDEAARQYEHAIDQLERDPALAPEIDRIDLTAAWADALSAAGQSVRAIAMATRYVDELPAGTSDDDRARALAVLAQAALIEDSWLALETSREALALLPVEPRPDARSTAQPAALRARLLSMLARASLGNRRLDDAIEAGTEALDLGERLGLPTVVADVTTTLARLQEYTGDPKSSAVSLGSIIQAAMARGDAAAELRARHHLGGVHLGEGDLARAYSAYRAGGDRAIEMGRPWAPYGLDSRVLGAICAYMMGDWQAADELIAVTGSNPPAMAEAELGAVGLLLAAGRGQPDARSRLAGIQRFWSFDGLIAVTSAFAAIDLHGDAGDLAAAIAVHDEAVAVLTKIWGVGEFLARVRLSALLIGQLAVRAEVAGQSDRQALVEHGRGLLDIARRSFVVSVDRPQQVGPEGEAWAARAEAEFARLSWIAGVDPLRMAELATLWESTVEHFTRLGNPFEEARSRARWAAALGAGKTNRSTEVAAPAVAIAQRLGATVLLEELRGMGFLPGRAGRPTRAVGHADQRRRTETGAESLTPREAEILALVAQGRSNGEIGKRLFISTKTVSVHVSNILAKLGAAGRTEAAAIGRDRGLV